MKNIPTQEFLAEHGKAIVRHINHEEYVYEGRVYVCGWDSNLNPETNEVYGWHVWAKGRVDCPDCHGEGTFPDSTSGISFNRVCGLCKLD